MEHHHSKQDVPSLPDEDPALARTLARRRFLKGGSLALPAVMTLHSVSAQATARQSAYCYEDINQNVTQVTIPGTDNYYRRSVDVYAKLVSGPNGYVSDGQATYFYGSVNAAGVWRYVANGTQVPTHEIPLINASINGLRATPTNDPGLPVGTRNAIVRFDSTSGTIVSVGAPNGENQHAMVTSLTGACLHSLWGKTV